MKIVVLWAVLLCNHILTYGQTAAHRSENVLLKIVHVVDARLLVFDSSYYNAFGEQYSVNKFRYYISNITFKSSLPEVKTVTFDTSFLVDEMKPDSKQIALNVPGGSYSHISFLLGVDSIKNVSGAQSGALDPLLDMFWTWNTGYVMAKLEGNSPISKLPHHMIEYHIGGFAGKYNVLKNIELNNPNGKVFSIDGTGTTQIVIEANVNAWFNGVHEIKIAGNSACTSIGELAQQIAENYSKMFIVRSISAD